MTFFYSYTLLMAIIAIIFLLMDANWRDYIPFLVLWVASIVHALKA